MPGLDAGSPYSGYGVGIWISGSFDIDARTPRASCILSL